MPELELEVARWLTSVDGLAAVAEATCRLDAGEDELRVITVLRTRADDPGRTAGALAAAIARRRARRRWPDAERLLFTREALEQASDPAVADHRAARFVGHRVHDLCSGIGGDAIAIARRADTVTAVDLDRARLALLAHNAAVSGVSVAPVLGDALTVQVPLGHVVHVDPARRRDGRRVADPNQTIPPVPALVARHGRGAGLAVVLAPGTDADHPALGPDVEVEYLQLGDDLVEAVAWSGCLRDAEATASATLLPRPGSDGTPVHRARSGARRARLPIGPVGEHLVEIAVAAIRARLHDDIGAEIGAHRLARQRALLSVSGSVPPSVWYRARPVIAVLQARPAAVRRWLATADLGPMELVLHGVRVDPDGWWRELGRPPRGPGGIRIELVRRDGDQVAIVTRDVPRV